MSQHYHLHAFRQFLNIFHNNFPSRKTPRSQPFLINTQKIPFVPFTNDTFIFTSNNKTLVLLPQFHFIFGFKKLNFNLLNGTKKSYFFFLFRYVTHNLVHKELAAIMLKDHSYAFCVRLLRTKKFYFRIIASLFCVVCPYMFFFGRVNECLQIIICCISWHLNWRPKYTEKYCEWRISHSML
jgi:hypothetical protein